MDWRNFIFETTSFNLSNIILLSINWYFHHPSIASFELGGPRMRHKTPAIVEVLNFLGWLLILTNAIAHLLFLFYLWKGWSYFSTLPIYRNLFGDPFLGIVIVVTAFVLLAIPSYILPAVLIGQGNMVELQSSMNQHLRRLSGDVDHFLRKQSQPLG